MLSVIEVFSFQIPPNKSLLSQQPSLLSWDCQHIIEACDHLEGTILQNCGAEG